MRSCVRGRPAAQLLRRRIAEADPPVAAAAQGEPLRRPRAHGREHRAALRLPPRPQAAADHHPQGEPALPRGAGRGDEGGARRAAGGRSAAGAAHPAQGREQPDRRGHRRFQPGHGPSHQPGQAARGAGAAPHQPAHQGPLPLARHPDAGLRARGAHALRHRLSGHHPRRHPLGRRRRARQRGQLPLLHAAPRAGQRAAVPLLQPGQARDRHRARVQPEGAHPGRAAPAAAQRPRRQGHEGGAALGLGEAPRHRLLRGDLGPGADAGAAAAPAALQGPELRPQHRAGARGRGAAPHAGQALEQLLHLRAAPRRRGPLRRLQPLQPAERPRRRVLQLAAHDGGGQARRGEPEGARPEHAGLGQLARPARRLRRPDHLHGQGPQGLHRHPRPAAGGRGRAQRQARRHLAGPALPGAGHGGARAARQAADPARGAERLLDAPAPARPRSGAAAEGLRELALHLG